MMPEPVAEREPGGTSPGRMPAEFGLATATFVIVASMVGVGILTTSGYTVEAVHSNQLMLGLWVIGGVMAVSGALTLAELSAALPKTGGDYIYLYESYGPLAAFLSGWVSFLMGFAGPIAASSVAAAKYLLVPFHLSERVALPAQRGVATLAILAFALIHTSSRSRTARVQGAVTALKIVVLGLFMIAGLVAGRTHFDAAHFYDRPPIDVALVASMMFSLVYISYAYIGWNAASFLAGEVAEPQRRLPLAIMLGTAGVVVLYLGLNTVFALALSAAEIHARVADPANPHPFKPDAVATIAQLAAERLFGPGWSNRLSVGFGLMLLSSLSAYVLTGPRVVYAMAQANQFPAIAGRLHARSGTPAIATALQVSISLVLLWTGSFGSILVFASVGLAIFSMLSMSAIYILRRNRPDLPRPFRTPGYPVTPAIYLALTAILIGAAFYQSPLDSLIALAGILAGVPLYYLWRRLGKPASDEPGAELA